MKNLLVGLLSLICLSLNGQTLSEKEKEILKHIDANYDQSLSFLEKSVNINSGTFNTKGVREVGVLFDEEFKKIGFDCRWINMPAEMKRAGHLFAEHKGTKGKRLLLIGHLDTVFEPESPFQKWLSNDSVGFALGANDMKSGYVIILYALKALMASRAIDQSQIIVALHGDEEHGGNPDSISRKDIY